MSCASATTSARTGAASGRSSFGWFCPISGGSVRFRVVLSDDAAKHRLRQAATSVMGRLAERLNFPALGVFPYHNFRSRVAGRSVGLSGVCGRLAKRRPSSGRTPWQEPEAIQSPAGRFDRVLRGISSARCGLHRELENPRTACKAWSNVRAPKDEWCTSGIKDKHKPTQIESDLKYLIAGFIQLRKDDSRAVPALRNLSRGHSETGVSCSDLEVDPRRRYDSESRTGDGQVKDVGRSIGR